MLGGNKPKNIRPVIKFKNEEWERLPEPEIANLEDGRTVVYWTIKVKNKLFEIAMCYPYGKDNIEKLLKDTDGYWKINSIGISQKEREIIRISNIYNNPEKRGIYLIARQHSGETPGSWVLDGLLRYIAEINYQDMVVWIAPLLNIDGIEEGLYGKDNFPYDLNRAWGNPPMRHETLVIQRDLARWKDRCKPFLTLDFHAPGGCETDGVYFHITSIEENKKRHKIEKEIADRIAKKIGKEFISPRYIRSVNYKSRWETPHFTDFCREKLKIPSLTIEVPYSLCGNLLMKIENYKEIGRRIAMSIIEEK